MSVLDGARLGIMRDPRHHTLPQEQLAFFQARGFPGREIDKYCVQLSTPEHERLHGFNQSLARRHWKDHEWSTELMRQLNADEAELQLSEPGAKISREKILEIMEKMRVIFGIADRPFVEYHAQDAPFSNVEEMMAYE